MVLTVTGPGGKQFLTSMCLFRREMGDSFRCRHPGLTRADRPITCVESEPEAPVRCPIREEDAKLTVSID